MRTDPVATSYDPSDECVFGVPSYAVAEEFYAEYRRRVGLCKMTVGPTHVSGPVGYSECRGNYMCEAHVSIPYYGQTAQALVRRVRRIQRLLEERQ